MNNVKKLRRWSKLKVFSLLRYQEWAALLIMTSKSQTVMSKTLPMKNSFHKMKTKKKTTNTSRSTMPSHQLITMTPIQLYRQK